MCISDGLVYAKFIPQHYYSRNERSARLALVSRSSQAVTARYYCAHGSGLHTNGFSNRRSYFRQANPVCLRLNRTLEKPTGSPKAEGHSFGEAQSGTRMDVPIYLISHGNVSSDGR